MRPKLKPPGTKRLKLNCGVLLSTSAFKFNLRCYVTVSLQLTETSFVPVFTQVVEWAKAGPHIILIGPTKGW
jgi:hypothetical protein